MEKETVTVKTRAIEKLQRDLTPLLIEALSDPKTVEIMLNEDVKLWQEKLGEEMCCIGSMSANRAESIIKTIAGYYSKEIKRSKPFIEGELPIDGSRFAGQLPPIVKAPVFAIRKKASSVFTLAEYVKANIMTESQMQIIKTAIENHRNILVIGGTSSGKTTLVNAIIHQMVKISPAERLVIIEDTGEIQCAAQNVLQYHTTMNVSMTDLLRITLRMRPDRILVGEVRGEEALDLLDAWNTGHEGGVATLHANNPLAGLYRLKSLISRNRSAPKFIEPLIAEAVHFVVYITRTKTGRVVKDIMEVKGFENGAFITKSPTTCVRN